MVRWKFTILILAALLASGASLPRKGPVPDLLEERKTPQEEKEPGSEPLPKAGTEPEKDHDTPSAVPEEKLAVRVEDPVDYRQCLKDLKAMGAVFEETPRIDDADGCGIDKPLTVEAVATGVALEPAAQMRCPAALALAKWVQDSVRATAETAFGTGKRLTAIDQASSYVCRLRNGAETGKISEHARGNAIDIAGLRLGEDLNVSMTPRKEDGTMTGAFQRSITASACLYFSTVLSPGSDAAHETHLHLDALERDNGFRYCR